MCEISARLTNKTPKPVHSLVDIGYFPADIVPWKSLNGTNFMLVERWSKMKHDSWG